MPYITLMFGTKVMPSFNHRSAEGGDENPLFLNLVIAHIVIEIFACVFFITYGSKYPKMSYTFIGSLEA